MFSPLARARHCWEVCTSHLLEFVCALRNHISQWIYSLRRIANLVSMSADLLLLPQSLSSHFQREFLLGLWDCIIALFYRLHNFGECCHSVIFHQIMMTVGWLTASKVRRMILSVRPLWWNYIYWLSVNLNDPVWAYGAIKVCPLR